uniref:Uncharacterized protein n=1 Tax=Anguilla anguilla TaxID=7936 RepID=A0A0E9X176_ANGAN
MQRGSHNCTLDHNTIDSINPLNFDSQNKGVSFPCQTTF